MHRFLHALQVLGRPTAIALSCLAWVGCEANFADTTSAPQSAVETPPNVVLIVVDTLRADHLSHYGYARDTAMALDDFRAQSTLFSRAYSTAPWTGPSTISIHTGLSPARHGANAHGDVLPDEANTIAEYLSGAGYSTYGISYNYEVSKKTGYDQGFDVFNDYKNDVLDYPDIGFMVKRVDRWIDSKAVEPYFLYLQPMNTHGPYRVPPERQETLLGHRPSRLFEYYGDPMESILQEGDLDRRDDVTPEIIKSLVDQYDVAVHYTMEEVASILKALEDGGLLDNTLVVLTSDHGEELFDHGGFSHGYSLNQEVIRVPLYLRMPRLTGMRTSDRIVSTLDILPTILELTNLPSEGDLDGRSLIEEAPEERNERLLVQRAAWAKRALGWSLVRGNEHLIDMEHAYDATEAQAELFDLSSDPGEQHDRAQGQPDRLIDMRTALDARLAELDAAAHLKSPENVLSEMDQERLRALGYVE